MVAVIGVERFMADTKLAEAAAAYAEERTKLMSSFRDQCLWGEAYNRAFLAGIAWRDANPSAEVLALVEALDGADSILVCAGFPNADLMDIIATAQKRISEALSRFAKQPGGSGG